MRLNLTARDAEDIRRAILESSLPSETAGALLGKLTGSAGTPGVDARALEDALVASARGKVLRTTGSGYARISRQGAQQGATPDAMRVVGAWVADQAWLDTVTALTVLAKWADWYPRARAWDSKGSEYGGDVRPDSGEAGETPPGGRRGPGFR